jgi:hypothetical protein
MSNCPDCGRRTPQEQELQRVKQQAAKESEEKQVDIALYYDPQEGWKHIVASQAAGLPVRELVCYTRPAAG